MMMNILIAIYLSVTVGAIAWTACLIAGVFDEDYHGKDAERKG